MLKKIAAVSLCALTLSAFSQNIFTVINPAQTAPTLFPITRTLTPNAPFNFENPLGFTVKVACTVHTEDASDKFRATLLKGSGKFNNQPIHAGQTVEVEVHNNDKVKIEGEGGAKISLVNLGEHAVVVNCDVGF